MLLKKILEDESGATSIEYTLLLGLLALVLIVTLQFLGLSLTEVLDTARVGMGNSGT